jgi:hypothetical protein
MIRRWGACVLVAVLTGLLSMAVSGAVARSAPARSPMQRSLLLHLRWRLVTRELNSVATSDRYLALLTYPDPQTPYDSGSVILQDQQTNTQRLVALPTACNPNRAPVGFGGPWLVVACGGPVGHWLYNLNSRGWEPVSPSPECPVFCDFVGVGRHWLKFTSDNGCSERCGNTYFLQNLQTGRAKPDPAKPGGRTLDDLNSTSGAIPLCPPLRYPTSQNVAAERQEPGTLQFSGQFALASGNVYSGSQGLTTFYHLERCRSRHVLVIEDAGGFAPFISSRAVVTLGVRKDHCKKVSLVLACTTHEYIRGVYLPSLRQFTASLPTTRVPQYSDVVGLTRRTIYVQADAGGRVGGPLWAATLPQPRPPHHQ